MYNLTNVFKLVLPVEQLCDEGGEEIRGRQETEEVERGGDWKSWLKRNERDSS